MNPEYARLAPIAQTYFAAEKERIAAKLRASAAERSGLEEEAKLHHALAESFQKGPEKAARNALADARKRLPVAEWLDSTKGLGDTMLLFLGLIGDPLWNGAEDRARRGPGELIAYLGMDPRDGRARRMQTNGDGNNFNRFARTILLGRIAESAYRQGDYAPVYRARREKDADAVHMHVCMNGVKPVAGKPAGSNGCGTRAHPEWGEIGSPLRDGHKHRRALRAVGRQIVLDLWNEARRVHERVDPHPASDPARELVA